MKGLAFLQHNCCILRQNCSVIIIAFLFNKLHRPAGDSEGACWISSQASISLMPTAHGGGFLFNAKCHAGKLSLIRPGIKPAESTVSVPMAM